MTLGRRLAGRFPRVRAAKMIAGPSAGGFAGRRDVIAVSSFVEFPPSAGAGGMVVPRRHPAVDFRLAGLFACALCRRPVAWQTCLLRLTAVRLGFARWRDGLLAQLSARVWPR